jgi:hypothetical protein
MVPLAGRWRSFGVFSFEFVQWLFPMPGGVAGQGVPGGGGRLVRSQMPERHPRAESKELKRRVRLGSNCCWVLSDFGLVGMRPDRMPGPASGSLQAAKVASSALEADDGENALQGTEVFNPDVGEVASKSDQNLETWRQRDFKNKAQLLKAIGIAPRAVSENLEAQEAVAIVATGRHVTYQCGRCGNLPRCDVLEKAFGPVADSPVWLPLPPGLPASASPALVPAGFKAPPPSIQIKVAQPLPPVPPPTRVAASASPALVPAGTPPRGVVGTSLKSREFGALWTHLCNGKTPDMQWRNVLNAHTTNRPANMGGGFFKSLASCMQFRRLAGRRHVCELRMPCSCLRSDDWVLNVESDSRSDRASAVNEVCGFAFTSLLLRDPAGVRLIENHWRDVISVIQTSAELHQTLPRYGTGVVQAG